MAVVKKITPVQARFHSGESVEVAEAPGFYAVFTGRNVEPVTRKIRIGRHGTGKGSLLRGAKYLARTPGKLEENDVFTTFFSRGYRKCEIVEVVAVKGARKTGISFILEAQ